MRKDRRAQTDGRLDRLKRIAMKRANWIAIFTDVHLWVPVVVLILGTTLLMMLR